MDQETTADELDQETATNELDQDAATGELDQGTATGELHEETATDELGQDSATGELHEETATDELGQDTASGELNDLRTLYDHAYSLFKGKSVAVDQLQLIKPYCVLDCVYNWCVHKMKIFDQLNKLEKSFLSVLLSGTINTININHRPAIAKYLSQTVLNNILHEHKLDNFDKFHDSSMEKLMSELKEAYLQNSISGLRELIYTKKIAAIRENMDVKNSKGMMLLDIYDHISNMVEYSSWDNESEAGYIDYWKPLFRILFRNTNISIRSGETACVATRYDRQLNELEHGGTSKHVTGRKIDLLISCKVDGDVYELSSLEFKPEGVTDLAEIIQQNKNIRINKSILTNLARRTGDVENTFVIGMDVTGNKRKNGH
ncbi:unnamed protein product [Absidia cylindrospora]